MKADLLLLDGKHLLWRTSDAHKDLVAKVDGVEVATGGLYGFLCVALRVHSKVGGKVAVAWEGKGNFRLKLYPPYKHKNVPPDFDAAQIIHEMKSQEDMLKEFLADLGVPQYLGNGCEADDVLGRLASEAEARGERVIIYTGDSDLRQCCTELVSVLAPAHQAKGRAQDRLYGPAEVLEKHLVPPGMIAQHKALAGDSSDNIPGVVGVGEKTAAILLNHYGSLGDVLRAAVKNDEDWPSTPRYRRLVAEQWRQALFYLKLTTIQRDADMDMIPYKRDKTAVLKRIRAYRFISLSAPAELHGLMSLGAA